MLKYDPVTPIAAAFWHPSCKVAEHPKARGPFPFSPLKSTDLLSWIVFFSKTRPAGATFVTNQFWCSLMFSSNVVGTANATAAGWGNLGGGVTQIFMISVLFNPMVNSGMAAGTAWRVAMIVPAVLFLICAANMKLLCWDTPTAKRFDVSATGKTQKPSLWDYVVVLKDIRVVVMIFQYSACFGTELAMNNQLATHFRTYFQMDAADASALAGAFGLMNLFARSLGGIGSDILSSTSVSEGAFGRNSWLYSLKQFSSSASAWWIARSHGMLLWPFSFVSPFLSRWQKAQATRLCRS